MHRRSFLAGSCFVLALAALTLIGTLSPSYQKCAADHQRDHAQNEQPNLHEGIASHAQIPVLLICEGAFIDANNGTLTALATIAIAAFTLTLWLATTNQGRLTRESIELGNREFGATHRPRVRIAYIRLNPLQAGVHATAEIWATNIGDGDAQIIEIGADIFVRRKNMAGTAAMGATPRPYPVPRVAPGQQANLQVRGGLPIKQQTIDGIQGTVVGTIVTPRTTELCAVGTIHYLDANGTRRLTSFFRVYNPDRLRFVRAPEDDEYAEWDYEA
jgi:hypothetical protein